jgi:hypothetical protein
MRNFILGLFLINAALSNAQINCWNIGDGSDGVFHATVDTNLASGTYNYTSFTIDAGVTVSTTGTSALVIQCTNTVTINGAFEVNGANGTDGVKFTSAGIGAIGVAGGGNGGDGVSPSSPGSAGIDGGNTGGGVAGLDWTGGGGGGYANTGGSTGGATGGFGGITYGTSNLAGLEAGSGGGGGSGGNNCGSGGGGAGGGVIVINAQAIAIGAAGVLSSNGGDGGSTISCGGGGAGSGGALLISAPSITHDGIISAAGGAGGASQLAGDPFYGVGGVGSEGRIRIDGTVNGAGLTTPTAYSNAVIPQSSQTLSICGGDSVVVGASTYYTTGSYDEVFASANGCDSTVTTNLTVEAPIATSITSAAGTLSSDESGASYQWLDCDNGNASIPGATSQDFIPFGEIGNYAVEVTVNGCTITTACFAYGITSVFENSSLTVKLFPNPTTGMINISFGAEVVIESLVIIDVTGRIILKNQELNVSELTLDLSNESNGVYFLKLQANGSAQSIKILKK